MARSALHIDRLRIRAGGLTAQEGEQLGAAIGAILGEQLAEVTASRDLRLLNIRVNAIHGESVESLARRIATTITAAISS